jgi:quinone-modifying oxidoreductase subunit QmoC
MADQLIKPDLNFVKDVIASGGESLKKCFQCATCSVVCNLSPDDKPFPRKEMIYAQWGLKDKLFSNPDIWLCHQCSDCTAYCPRGAKPGEVLGAVRKMAIKNYSSPSFLANIVNDPKYLIVLFGIPIVIFLIIIGALGNFSYIPKGEDGGISLSKFIPPLYVDIVFVPTAAFAALCFVLAIRKYWMDMRKGVESAGKAISGLYPTIMDILTHKNFKQCDVAKDRKNAHLLLFYSFAGLAITTTIGVFYLYILKWDAPYPQTNIIKLIGNASAIALLIGITLVVTNRIKNKDKAGIGGYFDWLLICIIYGVVATGILSEVLRLANISLAYPMYFSHLVFVFVLFAYAPFSKMAHMVYRTVAMTFAKCVQREKA